MRKIFKSKHLFILLALALSSTNAKTQNHYKVFILSGQSNCNGNVPINQWPVEMNKTHTSIKCWIGETYEDINPSKPAPRANVRTWQALAPGWGYDWSGFAGPELSMGYTLSQLYPNDKIAIIKCNRPGQALHSYFRPPSRGGTLGQGYTTIVNSVNTALASIGGTYEIAGMGWIQGESDMMEGKGAEYEGHLKNLISDLRSEFKSPNMQFAISQTIPNWGDATQGPLVRNAQQKVADDLQYVGIFDPSTDKVRFPIGVNDNHFVPPGSINLGIDLAHVLHDQNGKDKQVGIAYSPWHPNAVWSDAAVATNAVCSWAKPQLGYYKSNDLAVIDKHTDWLTDAGIDYVSMDWSNNCGTQNQWLEAFTEVFVDRQVWRKNNGLPYVQVCIMIGCPFNEAANVDGTMNSEVQVVKTNYIDHATRGAVYYKHRGKPLVIAYQNGNWNYNSWNHSQFDANITIRNMFATLVQNNMYDKATMRSNNGLWSWSENVHPPTYAYDGRPEWMAAHAALRTCGWWGPESYNQVDAGLKNCIDTWGGAKGRRNGETLRESFAYAKKYDVDVVQVMSFNEWTGCESSQGEQRNPEYSNDMEPTEGGFGALYLKILKEEVYKFKGWDINNPSTASSPNYWHFTNSIEGWNTIQAMSNTVSNSIFTANITGNDPYMHSPDNLNISATDYKYVVLSMQNQTSASTAELFWVTTTATGYDGTKRVSIPVVSNDSKQRTYIIDLSANPNWTGMIKQIRLDPTIASSGTVKIDYIKFVGTKPNAPLTIPGTIQAEDFNIGGQGNAYNDNDPSNNGGQYRTSEGVDIETCSDAGGGYNLGWNSTNEWQEYLVNVTKAGTYDLAIRVAAISAGQFHVNINGENTSGSIAVSNTGGVQSWTTVNTTLTLSTGLQLMRIYFDDANGNFNINSLVFTESSITGIENNESSNLIAVYPNPANNTLNVLLKNVVTIQTFNLFNSVGEIVLTNSLDAEITVIDLSNIDAGVYFLKVGNSVHKVIVNK